MICTSLSKLCPGRGVCHAWDAITPLFLQAGAFVLDPMCGLGTILLEAAKEWPVSIASAMGRTFVRLLVVASRKICTSYTEVHYWKAGTKMIFLGSC